MQMLSQESCKQKQTEDTLGWWLKSKGESFGMARWEIYVYKETVASLKTKLKEAGVQAENQRQRFNAELKTRDSEKEKLSSDLQSKTECISHFQNCVNSIASEKEAEAKPGGSDGGAGAAEGKRPPAEPTGRTPAGPTRKRSTSCQQREPDSNRC